MENHDGDKDTTVRTEKARRMISYRYLFIGGLFFLLVLILTTTYSVECIAFMYDDKLSKEIEYSDGILWPLKRDSSSRKRLLILFIIGHIICPIW